ncbi:hypothetical protein U9M48_045046 [Paspalum notatum var. saurae]|uniref:Uncharacterized protein n=1 Tax=Paspalum notatum var. saurae TaxID=547442 RepID=A0AAQ3UWG9_PASNO
MEKIGADSPIPLVRQHHPLAPPSARATARRLPVRPPTPPPAGASAVPAPPSPEPPPVGAPRRGRGGGGGVARARRHHRTGGGGAAQAPCCRVGEKEDEASLVGGAAPGLKVRGRSRRLQERGLEVGEEESATLRIYKRLRRRTRGHEREWGFLSADLISLLLICKPRVSATDVDITFTLGAFAGGLLSDPSKEFYASHANITANKSPKDKSHFDWKQPALEMSKAVEDMYINQSAEEKIGEASSKPKQSSDLDYWQTVHGKSASEVEGWELVSKEQIKNMHHDTLLSHGSKGFLLEISDLTGPVLGLLFNNQFGNILAAAGKGDTLNLYHIDCHGTDLSRTYKFQDDEMSNAQVTFLEWHPRYSAILASTNDRGTTTVWDIRTKKAAMRAKQQPNEYCSEVHWHPNHPTCFAVASNSNYELAPVKIWDANLFGNMLCEFGPRKGVNSLSWSTTNDLILTTDVDGIIDCWNVKLTTDKSMGQCVAVSVGSCGAVHTTTAGVEA